MTSASKLFYKRRTRLDRSAVELGDFDSSLDHYSCRHRRTAPHHGTAAGGNSRRDRVDLDGCDSLRRSTHPRHSNHRLSERELVWVDQSSQSTSGNANASENGGGLRDRLRFNGNDRLPGAVLLARERLLQRLRGVSISGSRRNNGISSSSYDNDLIVEDDFRLVDDGDMETEISREWQAESSTFTNSLRQGRSKRPLGLTGEASDCLLVETFSNLDKRDEGEISRASEECSICLESFLDGDKLIRLPCGHRFHHCCLDPWVRICGCCPYCRKDITITNYKA